jgi:hypothetical protein
MPNKIKQAISFLSYALEALLEYEAKQVRPPDQAFQEAQAHEEPSVFVSNSAFSKAANSSKAWEKVVPIGGGGATTEVPFLRKKPE